MAISTGNNKPRFWSIRNIFYQSYRLKNRPELIIGLLALCFLSFVVLVPLFQIIKDALTFQSYDLAYEPDGVVGEFTLFHLDRVFNQPISAALFYKPLLNSLKMGFAVTVIALSVGFCLAWLMVRTNVYFKGEPIYSIFFSMHNGVACYLYGAGDINFKDRLSGTYCLWRDH